MCYDIRSNEDVFYSCMWFCRWAGTHKLKRKANLNKVFSSYKHTQMFCIHVGGAKYDSSHPNLKPFFGNVMFLFGFNLPDCPLRVNLSLWCQPCTSKFTDLCQTAVPRLTNLFSKRNPGWGTFCIYFVDILLVENYTKPASIACRVDDGGKSRVWKSCSLIQGKTLVPKVKLLLVIVTILTGDNSGIIKS